MSYGSDAKASHLQGILWEKDTPRHLKVLNNDNGEQARKACTAGSNVNEVEMLGRIHADLFYQDKYLLNKVSMKIRCVRSKYSFSLMAGGVSPSFKIKIQEAILFVRKVSIN